MADRHDEVFRHEDMISLKSRISWGAIFGGSVIAFTVYLVFTLLFAAVGLSLSGAGVQAGNVGIGAVIAAVVTMGLALFAGGWVTTQLTAGETRREAMVHGLLTWATVTALSVAMVGAGVRAGYNALVDGAVVASNQADARNWEDAARRAGVPQERIDQWRQNMTPEAARDAAQNPENLERARHGAMVATWGTLLGILLSMAASVVGAMAGCGPTFRLFPVAQPVGRREVVITQ